MEICYFFSSKQRVSQLLMHASCRQKDWRNKLGRKPSDSTGVNKKVIKPATSLSGRNHIRQQIREQQLVAQTGFVLSLLIKVCCFLSIACSIANFQEWDAPGKKVPDRTLSGTRSIYLMLDQIDLSYSLQHFSSLDCYCCLQLLYHTALNSLTPFLALFL